MANNHRAQIVTRSDYDNYWALRMWQNPNVKSRIVKCELCSGRERIQRERRRNTRNRLNRLEIRENLELID
jgi:hypothetical protein